jgi:hypothetical protein
MADRPEAWPRWVRQLGRAPAAPPVRRPGRTVVVAGGQPLRAHSPLPAGPSSRAQAPVPGPGHWRPRAPRRGRPRSGEVLPRAVPMVCPVRRRARSPFPAYARTVNKGGGAAPGRAGAAAIAIGTGGNGPDVARGGGGAPAPGPPGTSDGRGGGCGKPAPAPPTTTACTKKKKKVSWWAWTTRFAIIKECGEDLATASTPVGRHGNHLAVGL